MELEQEFLIKYRTAKNSRWKIIIEENESYNSLSFEITEHF